MILLIPAIMLAVAVMVRPKLFALRSGHQEDSSPQRVSEVERESRERYEHSSRELGDIRIKYAGTLKDSSRYSARSLIHSGRTNASLNPVDTEKAIDSLFACQDAVELANQLSQLIGSNYITRQRAETLLNLFDVRDDPRVRNAILEVLLYCDDEPYVVQEIARRLDMTPIADSTYPILAAFPAHLEMLTFLVRRLEAVPIESAAAAKALNKVFWEIRNPRNSVELPRIAKAAQGQIETSKSAEVRASLLYFVTLSGDASTPVFIASWWVRESDLTAKRKILEAAQAVPPSQMAWARTFLSRVLEMETDPNLLSTAKESLDALTPIIEDP